MLYVLYIIIPYIYNLKKQFKVQIIGILEEILSFIDQKCTSWKCDKNLGRALPPPSFGQNPKEQPLFVRETFP